jgi:hypothetical protein
MAQKRCAWLHGTMACLRLLSAICSKIRHDLLCVVYEWGMIEPRKQEYYAVPFCIFPRARICDIDVMAQQWRVRSLRE